MFNCIEEVVKDDGTTTLITLTTKPLDVPEQPAGVTTVKLYVPEAVAVYIGEVSPKIIPLASFHWYVLAAEA